MKFSIKPVAAAVTLALVASAAHAQLAAPGYSPTAPSPGIGSSPIVLSIYDPTTMASDVVNLSLNFAAVTAGGTNGGLYDPNAPATPFTSVTNPTGAAGNVLQLNFGTATGFSAIFGATDANAQYWVTGFNGSATGVGASQQILVTQPTGSTLPNGTFPQVGTINTTDAGAGKWLPNWGVAGNTTDTTGTALNNANNSNWGANGIQANAFLGSPTAAGVGNALNFYDLNKNDKLSGAAGVSEFQNATGAGFWFLTSGGDLTWNVPEGGTVPLPAAAWLLLSGLAGLGALSRPRRAVDALAAA